MVFNEFTLSYVQSDQPVSDTSTHLITFLEFFSNLQDIEDEARHGTNYTILGEVLPPEHPYNVALNILADDVPNPEVIQHIQLTDYDTRSTSHDVDDAATHPVVYDANINATHTNEDISTMS